MSELQEMARWFNSDASRLAQVLLAAAALAGVLIWSYFEDARAGRAQAEQSEKGHGQ